ncbi:hypothetical protein CMUS01_15406 [Colletotrichum musicola]|uniref:Ankyrin repeat protein n=1 Tax=Colletotrichum musicola TaxID=2175873 RepID=A0A8H6IWN3_9PEZI|nr:hypothetical protein CMUS01_15406 [Colletotrichum musicola]
MSASLASCYCRQASSTDRYDRPWVEGRADDLDGLSELVDVLIRAGVDVNAATPDNNQTALHLAARLSGNGGGVLSVADRLVEANADVMAVDDWDETALEAVKRMHSPLTELTNAGSS